MKKKPGTMIYSLAIMGLLLVFINGCQKKSADITTNNSTTQSNGSTVSDIDGNMYHTVSIGTQVWMVENLKTTKYRDGTPIPNVTDATAWTALSTGAYCNYKNDANNVATYGRLYNWYTVTNTHNLAPSGWHIPSDAEWTTLVTFLGGEFVAGGKLKEAGLTHWMNPNGGATNETGFTSLPGGYSGYGDTFYSLGVVGYWWTTTEKDNGDAWDRTMTYDISSISRLHDNETNGFSVRCIKD